MAHYTNGTAGGQISSLPGRLYGVIVNSHTNGTLRFNDGASGTTSAGVAASGVFTSSDVFTDGETVTIGGTTYTFVDALSSPAVVNEILIGASAAASLDNMKSAINGSAGAGTTYSTGTVANAKVNATTNTDTAQTVAANHVGTAGNSIATSTTCADVAWGAETLENGAEPSYLISNTFTFASGSTSLMFTEPIDFIQGLYATKGGTIDYTIIWD